MNAKTDPQTEGETVAASTPFELIEMTDEEVETLTKRNRKPKDSPFKFLLSTAVAGKTYRIDVPEGTTPTKVVSQLHTGANQANVKIKVRNRTEYIAVTIVGDAEK